MDLIIVLVALAAIWLVSGLACVGLCLSAARGDRNLPAPAARLRTELRARRFARSAA